MEQDLNQLSMAMFSPAFPVNPLPFINGLKQGVALNGTDWLKTEQAKRILYVLLCQSYGQLFDIDSFEQYELLKTSQLQ